MAASLGTCEMSDLCIGKPALRPLPLSVTIREALLSLRRSNEPYLAIWAPDRRSFTGKVCVANIISHLCSGENINFPAAALDSPVSEIISDRTTVVVRLVDHRSSLLESLGAILDDGAQNLVVPLKGSRWTDFCWVSPEDLLRFFLDSITIFSRTATQSITALGIVRTNVHSVRHHDLALSALSPLQLALADQTAVAVITDEGYLISEISPAAFSCCDEAAAAAFAALSAGEFANYLSRGGKGGEGIVRVLLRENGMVGLLELLEQVITSTLWPSSSLSSTSDDDDDGEESESDEEVAERRWHRSSMTAGPRWEEVLVCRPGSSLVAVMLQALSHRVNYLWVVDGDDYRLVGVVRLQEMLGVFRDQLV